MIREILRMGAPSLLRPSARVDAFNTSALDALIEDLRDTMAHANGAGIAAPQIGVNRQVVIFGGAGPNPRYPDRPEVPFTVLINPTLTPLTEDTEDGWEGCLSVPGMRGLVPRVTRIAYSGFDPKGERFERIAEGWHARVVQHECDHLWGVLYPMRITDLRNFGFTDILFPDAAPDED
jgi:peptide deformylase